MLHFVAIDNFQINIFLSRTPSLIRNDFNDDKLNRGSKSRSETFGKDRTYFYASIKAIYGDGLFQHYRVLGVVEVGDG